MHSNIGSHLTENNLELYARGDLSEDMVPRFEEHLILCAGCQRRLESIEEHLKIASVAARELRQQAAMPQRGWFHVSRLWAVPKPVWAAAFAVAALWVVIPQFRSTRTESPTDISLTATRGAGEGLAATSSSGNVVLNVKASELPAASSYKVAVASENGADVWSNTVQGNGQALRIPVSRQLSSGQYWVRFYAADGTTLLREFGLTVR